MNDAQKILTATREFLADETRWCKLAPARTRAGDIVSPASPEAYSRDLLNAVGVAIVSLGLRGGTSNSPRFIERAAAEMTGLEPIFISLLAFNDDNDHATVLRTLDRAIELAGEAA